MTENPPPVLGGARVLAYAVLDASVTYTGKGPLFVVGTPTEGMKELGPVPCLAITQDLETGEILLLHCDQGWDVLGLAGGYGLIERNNVRICDVCVAGFQKTLTEDTPPGR